MLRFNSPIENRSPVICWMRARPSMSFTAHQVLPGNSRVTNDEGLQPPGGQLWDSSAACNLNSSRLDATVVQQRLKIESIVPSRLRRCRNMARWSLAIAGLVSCFYPFRSDGADYPILSPEPGPYCSETGFNLRYVALATTRN